jgi:hypothetical protein
MKGEKSHSAFLVALLLSYTPTKSTVINLVEVVGIAPTPTRLKVDETEYYTTLEHEAGFEPTLD